MSKASALEALFRQNPMLAKGIIYQTAAEKSLYEFIKLMWEYVEPSRPFVHNWHIDAVAEHLEAVHNGQIKKLLINISPGFMKSLLSNVFYPAWVWIHKPQHRFIAYSYSNALTERDNIRFKQVIESDLYRTLWGDRYGMAKDKNTIIQVGNDKLGWKLASSVGSAVTGFRADTLICLTAKSMIQTDKGLISIGEIVNNKLDVLVAGYDEENIKWQRIESFQKNAFRPLVEIQFDGGSIKCTEGHRIYTQRGWVPASEITTDDNLWSLSSEAMFQLFQHSKEERISKQELQEHLLQSKVQSRARIQNIQRRKQSSLHGMRYDDLSSTSTSSQNSQENILQSEMLCEYNNWFRQSDAPGRHKTKTMQAMWRNVYSGKQYAEAGLLFSPMLWVICSVAVNKLSKLWNRIQTKILSYKIVFKEMCRSIPFQANQREWQWALCSWQSQSWVSAGMEQNIQSQNKKEGWGCLPDVWNDARATWQNAMCASYRLCEGEFGRIKFNNTLPFLSREVTRQTGRAGSLERRNIISVKKISETHECTYNLSVHPCHNFFADGVLVKNCDDLNSVTESESKSIRDSTNMWFNESLPTRINSPKDSSMIVIQQRTNEDDVSGNILANAGDEWTHLMIPMHFDPQRKCITGIGWEDPRTEDGELCWPEVYGEEEVQRLSSQMGSYATSGQFEQSPAPRGGGIIKNTWWQMWPKDGEALDEEGRPVRALEYPEMDFILGSVDPAYTEKKENDYSAMVVLGLYRQDGQPRVMLMDAWKKRFSFHGVVPERMKGESVREYLNKDGWGLVERVAYTAHMMQCDRIVVEKTASGIPLIQELQRLYGNEKFGVQGITPKGDKIARAHSIAHLLENGIVAAPNREWANMVIDDCAIFPRGAHDDLPDCFFQGLIHLRSTGWALRSNEHEEEIAPKEYKSKEAAIYDV